MQKALQADYLSTFLKKGVDADKAQTRATCLSTRQLAAYNAASCPVVNRAAETFEDLLFSPDSCFYAHDKAFWNVSQWLAECK